MSKYRISRREVIEAIQTEPLLAPGAWMRRQGRGGSGANWGNLNGVSKASNPECQVCAVGAVIRRVLADEAELSQGAQFVNTNIDVWSECGVVAFQTKETLFAKGAKIAADHPWNALSTVFETLARLHGLEMSRGDVGREAYLRALERVRADLVEFVEQHLPEDLVFSGMAIDVRKDLKKVEETT
jgi:hypothetical protein